MDSTKLLQVEDDANPYIALADLAINLVLVLAFFVAAVNALGRAGWEQVRYKDLEEQFRQAVAKMPAGVRPTEHRGKHDPPGVQRWVFRGSTLFVPGTAQPLHQAGSPTNPLLPFSHILKQRQAAWRRIRIEGHTTPPRPGQADNWELSAGRAAVVAREMAEIGHIPSYYLAVAGRAGQDPLDKRHPENPANERVEVLVEYTQPTFGSK